MLKGLSNITKQKRIAIYFILTIVLPSIMMGALAFRGIENDQAFIVQENRRKAIESGKQFISFTEGILSNQEQEFEKMVAELPVPEEAFFSDSILEGFITHHPSIRSVFHVKANEIKIFRSNLQYLPKGAFLSSQFSILPVNANLEIGWRYEFQERDNKKAISFYRELFPKLTDLQSKATALNAIARLQKKTGDFKAAGESYETIGHLYGEFQINTSMPLGLVADLELAKLEQEQGNIEGSLDAHLRIQENLKNRRWVLEEASYSFFANKAGAFLKEHASSFLEKEAEQLAQLDSVQRKRYESQLETKAILTLGEKVSSKAGGQNNTRTDRRHEESEGLPFLISFIPDNKEGDWCLVTSTNKLLAHHLAPQLRQSSAQGRWQWSIQNYHGEILVHSGGMAREADFVELSFPAKLPNWKLLAFSNPLTRFQTFLQSRQRIYFYIFLFIGAVLIAGLLFLMYSVNRELQLTKMKSDFIASVSHEFKSPLTAIRQITEMLQSGRVPSEKTDKYYSVMLQQGARLTHLIDNILDFSSIEQGKKTYVFEDTNIVSLIQKTVNRYQQRIQDKGFKINMNILTDLPKVKLDEKTIEQVIINLLDNAVKYSGNSRMIDISCEISNGFILTSVRDFGIGISKEDQLKIFDRFYRASNKQTHNLKGSGIGLTLAKEIIAAHGGKVQVSSTPDEGSTFYFYIPLAKKNPA